MSQEINASHVSRQLGDGGYMSLNRSLAHQPVPCERYTVGIYHDSSSHQSWPETRVVGPKMRGFQTKRDGEVAVLVLFHGRENDESNMLGCYTKVLENLGYTVEREPDNERTGRDVLRVMKP